MEALADRISRYLVSVHAAKEDDREIIAWGLFHVFSLSTQFVILLISAALLRAIPEVMSYAIMFGSLKRYAGGAHTNRNWSCLFTFTTLTYITYFLCRAVPQTILPYMAVFASLLALALVLIRAPVLHPNNPKPPAKRKQIRRKAIYIALAQTAIVMVSILFAPDWTDLWNLCGATGGFSAAFTLILPMPAAKAREVK